MGQVRMYGCTLLYTPVKLVVFEVVYLASQACRESSYMLFFHVALVTAALHVKTCKAAVNTPKPQWLLHPADRLLPSFPLRVVTGCLGWVGDVTDAFRCTTPIMESI